MPVGEAGYVYHFPLQWGEVAAPPPAPKKEIRKVDVDELTTFQDWLKQMVDGEAITQELGTLLNSLKEGVKTITAITKFPVTRSLARSDEEYASAADSAFKDEITRSPGAAGMMVSPSVRPVVIDVSKNLSVSYDPLLCSDNIEVGLPHGSIFMVSELVRAGTEPVAAGYALYGSATVLVISVGQGVTEFTLDEQFQFRLSRKDLEVPKEGSYFSFKGNPRSSWLSAALDQLLPQEDKETSRIAADCLVGDIHRILKRGGLLIDAPTSEDRGREGGGESISFRLAPLAFLLKQAGGAASNGSVPLLDLEPQTYKLTSPSILGSKGLVGSLEDIVRKFGDLLGSPSRPRFLEENAPTADVRDLIGSGGAKEVTGSSSGDDVQAKKTDDDTAGLVDLRNSYSQEPRSSYFP